MDSAIEVTGADKALVAEHHEEAIEDEDEVAIVVEAEQEEGSLVCEEVLKS